MCLFVVDSPAGMAIFWHVHGEASHWKHSAGRKIIQHPFEDLQLY